MQNAAQIIRRTAVAYLRCSTAGQRDEGVSLETQKEKIKAWANANDYDLLAFHEDAGISGGKAENRPGLQAALADASKHHAALVVYSLSRLARSTKDAITISERLEKAGADLVSLTERIDTTNAAGKMIFRLLAVLAEFERDLISERTSAALQFLTKTHRVGELRYGFDLAGDGKTLVPNDSEQAVVRKITALRAKGLSFAKIAELLTIIQTPTKQKLTKQGLFHWWPRVVRKIWEANVATA